MARIPRTGDRTAPGIEQLDADAIDRLVGQWRAERPDLDLGAMATVLRVLHLGGRLQALLEGHAGTIGVTVAEGDVLFALRRAGPPYRLAPSAISAALLVPSGTLTSRLDRLEAKGAIERVPHPTDRRSMEVQLTPQAVVATDEAVTAHVAREAEWLSVLDPQERAVFDTALRKLLAKVTAAPDPGR